MDFAVIDSPIGSLKISATDVGVYSVDFLKKETSKKTEVKHPHLKLAIEELNAFFKGKLKIFTVNLDLQGTEFQKSVWTALTKIPFGAACSYSDLAQYIKNPKAVRAVGGANNKNKIPIIIPCHRVIGRSGDLVGYAGGLDVKEKLLKLEGFLN